MHEETEDEEGTCLAPFAADQAGSHAEERDSAITRICSHSTHSLWEIKVLMRGVRPQGPRRTEMTCTQQGLGVVSRKVASESCVPVNVLHSHCCHPR